jgi:hypothetical protein
MQDFDTVIRDLIERNVINVEDGIGFATNQNNLLLELKGLTSGEDFMRTQAEHVLGRQVTQRTPQFTLTD